MDLFQGLPGEPCALIGMFVGQPLPQPSHVVGRILGGARPHWKRHGTYRVADLLMRDRLRWQAMGLVEALDLPQGCIGAGFVRNLVWDHRHRGARDCRQEDIDVLFYDQHITDAEYDAEIEATLRESAPDLNWSVKNQARMHLRNQDAPYISVEDAMRFWPETATAVAAMRSGNDCIIIAPFGLSDLDRLILRPRPQRHTRSRLFLRELGPRTGELDGRRCKSLARMTTLNDRPL